MQGPRAIYGKESKAEQTNKQKKKGAGGAVATKVIAAGYMSENLSMVARARSKGHSEITKIRGSAVRLPISFNKAAELN